MNVEEIKIDTYIFMKPKYRLPYGISLGSEYHVWEVSRVEGQWFQEYVHSPRKMVVDKILDGRFSLIQYEDMEILTLFEGARYISHVDHYEEIINNTKYKIN